MNIFQQVEQSLKEWDNSDEAKRQDEEMRECEENIVKE